MIPWIKFKLVCTARGIQLTSATKLSKTVFFDGFVSRDVKRHREGQEQPIHVPRLKYVPVELNLNTISLWDKTNI